MAICLPNDRHKPGVLSLFIAQSMEPIFSAPCLGRSAGAPTNLERDPLKWRGDTPIGQYALTHVAQLPRPAPGIGKLWIALDPVAGQALHAEAAGRHGLGIHGGRGDGALKVTHGGIRLADADMAALASVAGDLRFSVAILPE